MSEEKLVVDGRVVELFPHAGGCIVYIEDPQFVPLNGQFMIEHEHPN